MRQASVALGRGAGDVLQKSESRSFAASSQSALCPPHPTAWQPWTIFTFWNMLCTLHSMLPCVLGSLGCTSEVGCVQRGPAVEEVGLVEAGRPETKSR